ncbi:DUF960 family protein [Enterococcus pallens]|uniref:Uncharacterized protein n=1 Tax=Enterococcus pallens ATCC BAA-351 TaxID=1158607 RepID=R2Q9Q5_9ENTE|nr:DUF960 family protein [Enterococcus pallens]EOH93177.1 hypothetical protein UAU_02820 [Enterococcus pallens ATCC BAA-351]EOU24963.1 hypothetical protein I588_00951 [Enterococcus pallens ATCC BAA-351]OJG76696.1 hypothetical protein RV10_GL003296 [Enterococcus pallens]
MFEPTKPRKSEVPAEQLPEQMQNELWHMIFMRPHKGLPLSSPQRFNFFKNPNQTLSVVHSQSEPYFSDSVTAPYIQAYEHVPFPNRLYVYDTGEELIMTLEEKN